MRRRTSLITAMAVLLLAGWVLLDTRWGLVLGIRLTSALVPGEIRVATVQGSLIGPMQLRDVQFRHGGLTLSVDQLDLDWTLSGLLAGKLTVQDLKASGVKLVLPEQHARADTVPMQGVVLPVAIDLLHAHISDIQLRAANARPVLIHALAMAASLHQDRLDIKQFQLSAYSAQVSASGRVRTTESFPLTLAIDFHYQPATGKPLSGQGRLQGDLHKLLFNSQWRGPINGSLQAHAQDVLSRLTWRATLTLARLDLHHLQQSFPEMTISGQLQASGDKQVFRTESNLQLADKTLGKTELHLKSEGELALSHYQLSARGRFEGLRLPNAVFTLQASGSRKDLEIAQLELNTLKGRIQGQASLDWHNRLKLSAQLGVHELDTGQLAPDWPGRVSAQLTLASQQAGAGMPLHFTLQQVHGQLRGHPLTGTVDGEWSPQILKLKTVALNIAGVQVSAQGQLARSWDLHFHAHSDQLDHLLPAAQGKLNVQGVLTGSARVPRLVLDGEAQGLAYAKRQVGKLTVKMDMGLDPRARSFLDVQATNVQSRDAHWSNIQIQVDGTNAAQTIQLQAQGKQAQLQAALHGQFRAWRWQGQLDRFELAEAEYGRWQLQQPVRLQLARRQFALSSFCLAQNTAHLCLQGTWSDAQRQARLEIQTMPMHLLQPWLPPDIHLDGILNGHARLDTTATGKLQGELALSSPDKSVQIHFTQLKESLSLGASHLNATLDDKGLRAALHIPLSSGGGIDSQLRLPGWSPVHGLPHAQALVAELRLEQVPADVVTRLIPQTAQARGQFSANLQVSGTLGEPHLSGHAGWKGGTVLVPALGINIHNVSAEISSAPANTIRFSVKAQSGNGEVQLTGQTELAPARGWPTHASLTSRQLEVSNIPEAFILVDSKLELALQGNTINVTGEITVPKARLRPRELPTGAVPVSPDVVIVDAGKQTSLATRWQLTAHLQVQLGDDVDFKGFGITGKLRGNLGLNDEPGKLILGQGEISIANGTYRLRGQDLTIRRGKLIFSNTFVDDPALDVEAVRVINTVTAGVRLKGTLKQPQLTVFSEPSMSQSDALSYLLLGHSMNQSTQVEGQSVSNAASALGLVAGDYLAKGIGGTLGLDELRFDVNQTTQNTSLVLGKYLSPKLYLRYYSGIAESSRILQLQYQLSRRLQIQTESGYRGSQSITGGDIFFTVDY